MPTSSRSGSGRSAAGGTPSASAAAEAQTSPPAREHLERAGPLSDEVRRRFETGAPADAAARQERDPLRAGEPAGRLGGVARVGVLRQEADEAASELLVQGREQQRQHRLGDPGPAGQGGRERLQALEREQLPDERVKNRTVHDDRRKPGFRAAVQSTMLRWPSVPGSR